ncbi:MAG: WD40 repeat domain-containing protein [Rhizonema sp. PD38]|nr:WD40 repeat domain-containing protein [Rhizonema sp. PD38]
MNKLPQNLLAKSPAYQRARLTAIANLVKSNGPGHLSKYFKLLTDFEFIVEKTQHPNYGVDALISDYDLINYPEVEKNSDYNQEKVKALKLIQGALLLSAHILHQDMTQLREQLWGRLLSFNLPEIQAILSQIKASKTVWLRLLTSSLTSPGGSLLRTLTGHSHWVNTVAITPDGKYAISGSSDKTLKVWNLETVQEISTLTGHSHWVNTVAITPDGKYAISGSLDKTLKVWNLETAQQVSTLTGHSSSVNAVAITLDGKYAISGSRDKTLKLWNLETAQEISTLTGHSYWVNTVAITPDGKYAISGSSDNTLKVWNLETAQEVSALTGHSNLVNAVAITPDGKYAISGSWDNTLKLWNLGTGKVLTTFIGEQPFNCCAIAPDGVTIVAGDHSGRVHFWRLEGDL